MSIVANTVLAGEAAFLVSAQAELLTEALGCEIRKLNTPDLRIGVYDPVARRLVIFDGAGLAAMAKAETAELPKQVVVSDIRHGSSRASIHAALDPADAFDPPSRL